MFKLGVHLSENKKLFLTTNLACAYKHDDMPSLVVIGDMTSLLAGWRK